MRTTQFLLATLKETPADAEIASHKLMIRAGMIRKNAAGIYTWLPLGLRVLHKVTNIIREEMNQSGAIEMLMPSIQPAELWQESGRWEVYGNELLKIKDRHKRDFCYGPTHEEVITDLMRSELRSYKQLPLTLYQIQTKFRDEIRPRFGVMRAREFLMKDAYSFHIDTATLDTTYQSMYEAYTRIFTRMGLKFRAVLADSGNIGGKLSHEFHVLAESGEDLIAFSDQSNYAANLELAESLAQRSTTAATETTAEPMQMVATPGKHTIAEVCEFLQVTPEQTLKTIIVSGKLTPLVALVLRGDHELNETKASKLSEVAAPLTFASKEEIKNIIGCSVGSLGPIGLKIPVIVDREVANLSNFICGANEDGKHLVNGNWQRDAEFTAIADIRKVQVGDPSPDGKGKLQFARGIEVGHIFQLGDKYSKAMHATVLNAEGRATPLFMGCYGIGVSRTVAAAIEQNHDENGIIWPTPLAPFQIALIPISLHQSYRIREFTEKLYTDLIDAGFEVLFDDRKERTGRIFADMELIGIPYHIVISESNLDNGVVEYKSRREAKVTHINIENIIATLKDLFGAKTI